MFIHTTFHRTLGPAVLGIVASAALLACGGSGGTPGDDSGTPTIVVTTNILGDVVETIVGDQADVFTVMPVGSDPHAFQPSARDVDRIGSADAVVLNGGGFEAGLVDVTDSARRDGIATFTALDAVEPLEADHGHADDHDGDHGDGDDHDDEHDGDHGDGDEGRIDPHFFTDPRSMADVVTSLGDFLGALDGIDRQVLDDSIGDYVSELSDLDADTLAAVSSLPVERRVLLTNHDVFGYFAERYGFEVVGAVVPGGTTGGAASAGELAELARLIEDRDVPAIFVETSSSAELADTLAAEVDDVEVVELFAESLGEPGSGGDTYLDMMRTNAERIVEALS